MDTPAQNKETPPRHPRLPTSLTWVEQQARDVKELNALWYDTEGTWDAVHKQAKDLDELINAFNEASGVLKEL